MDNQLSTFSSEPRNFQGRERLDDSESCRSDYVNEPEHVFITHIHVTDVAAGLRRMPAGFYAAVEVEGKTTITSNKRTLIGKDIVEWDEEILLPSDQSSSVLIKLYASFELGPRLGNGELLRQFKTTVGDLLDLNEQLQAITLQDDEFLPSCSSVRIVAEKRACSFEKSAIGLDMSLPSETMSQLAQLTDMGHNALLRYHQRQNQGDLDEAVIFFEDALNECPFDDPRLSSALFNLATAKLIRCRVTIDFTDLDDTIALYRNALQLRIPGDLDHCATALALSFGLLARFQQQGGDSDKKDARDLLAQVVMLSSPDDYAHQAASFALRVAEVPMSIQTDGISHTVCSNPSDDDDIQKARATLQDLSDKDPRRASLLADLGDLLYRRFKASGDVADVDDAILMLENALELTPDRNPDRPGWLYNLGTSLCRRFQRLGDLSDLNKAISVSEDAVHFTPGDDSDRPSRLNILGISLSLRFRQLGDLRDITKSIPVFEEAVRLVADNHPDKQRYLVNLSNSLHCRFERYGDLADLNESISLKEEAMHIVPDGHADRPLLLNNLAALLSSRFQRFGDLADINRSILMLEKAVESSKHNISPDWFSNLGQSLLRRFERLGDLADIEKSISMSEKAVQLTPDRHPSKASRLSHLGSSLEVRFRHLGDLEDINKSILMKEEAARLIPDSHSDKPTFLNGLGNSLLSRFQHLGGLADINKSILLHEQAASLIAKGHPDKQVSLSNLANSLSFRFERLGDLADIERSISTNEEAIHLTPDHHPNKPTMLTNLGNSLLRRFGRLGDLADLNQSIFMKNEAVRLTPNDHPNKPAWLANLASSLSLRFERLGDIADIDMAISMLEEGLQLVSVCGPVKVALLNNFGMSLMLRFRRLGVLMDINKSISAFEEAVQLTPDGHSDRPIRMGNFSNALSRRFERFGDPADIKKSISMAKEAVSITPIDHPIRPTLLTTLGTVLRSQFGSLGDITNLNESILAEEEAVRLTSSGNPSKPVRLSNLGNSLNVRFQQFGDLADINKSVLMHEEAVSLTPDGHPDKPARLSNLGDSLFIRFERLGDLADINKSISINNLSVSLTPNGHPAKAVRLHILGNSLFHRFERLGDLTDINESIFVHEEAVSLVLDGHPTKAVVLNGLGTSLTGRFACLGDLADIDRSILLKEEVVHLTPDCNPNKPTWLSNFGNSLFLRFQRLGDVEDINKSISMHQQAVSFTLEGHPNKSLWMNNLGSAFIGRFRQQSQDPLDLSAAALHFSIAARASTGSTFARFYAVRGWISSALLKGDSEALLEAYSVAINLVPQLAWLGLPVTGRHQILLAAANIAREAAAAALEAGRPDMAIEWLEQGRSIVWSQILQLRTPVDDLCVEHPDIADQYQQISRELTHASRREVVTSQTFGDEPNADSLSLERKVQRYHDLTLRREKLLEEIRSLPGFDRFLLPRTVEQFVSTAISGPVVFLNASPRRCDAMIFIGMSRRIITVPLPSISCREVQNLEGLLRFMLKFNRLIISGDDVSSLVRSEEGHASQRSLDMILENDSIPEDDNRGARVKRQRIAEYTHDELFGLILKYLWNKIVRPIVRALGFSTPPPPGAKKMTRIFWCSTGPFSFLPVHAAGLYDSAAVPGTKLSDFAISSYIPTLGALSGAAAQSDANNSCPSSLIQIVAVPQPPTDGLAGLTSVKQEIDHIRELSTRSQFVTLQGSHGTVEDVMEKMKNADWVHFACHGMQDPHNPLESGLCLADKRRLRLSDIIHLSRPQGGLAFLSACQTAQGDEKLSEESVHLAAGMLLAGYGGVIATMWSIKDPDAPKVTEKVYEHLFRDGKVPDSMEAAEALHYAVQSLRDSGASFASWVPFIHVGR